MKASNESFSKGERRRLKKIVDTAEMA